MSLAEVVTESPFNNRQIHRALRTDTLREVVDELVKQATLRRSLEILQSQGRAQLFVGSSDDDTGVKIFP
ncbi:hypothetical protein IW147_003706 [Coemansia sp. RSA 720]|nr:hypothetical protein IW147_003706 [Coemansia sp. RSA 720]